MTSSASITPAFCAEAFSLTPDPHGVFLSRDHAEALAGLRLGLEYRRGLMVVVGEVGMGKTTVAYSLLAKLGDGIRTAYIANTRMPFEGILQHALEDFGVRCAERDRAGLLSALKGFLLECAEVDQIAVLVVDEAQSLDDETFENLRLLSNVETYRQKLLQIVLLGQPELDARLRQPQLRQIADRVGVRVNINPLGREESQQYIAHRLKRAGGSTDMFSPRALRFIVRRTRGVPRRMNIVCHNALLLAYAADSSQVTLSMAREAVRELAGGRLRLLARRRPPAKVERPGGGRHIASSWAAVGTALVAGGLLLASGLDRPSVTPPDTTAATVPWKQPAEPPTDPTAKADEPVVVPPGQEPVADAAPAAAAPPAGPVAGEPAPPTNAAAIAPPAAGGEPSTPLVMTVERGTTLMTIARQVYGKDSPELIRLIMRANPALSDPNLIVAGSQIVLPPAPGTPDLPANASEKKGS
jgi:general secretion pathway protein A